MRKTLSVMLTVMIALGMSAAFSNDAFFNMEARPVIVPQEEITEELQKKKTVHLEKNIHNVRFSKEEPKADYLLAETEKEMRLLAFAQIYKQIQTEIPKSAAQFHHALICQKAEEG